MIPKIIYYTWVSDKPLPEKFIPFIEGWKKIMPDYDIREINLSNCPRNEWIDKCIDSRKFVLAGHYARCQRLYETGGIYFDIDIEAVKKFDDLLGNIFFLASECNDVANNAVLGSESGHSLLKECMEYMDNFDINSEKAELETGPRMFTNILKKRGWNGSNVNTFIGDITVFNSKYFYPYTYNESFYPECITNETYAIHHWAGTWIKRIDKEKVSIIIPCYKQAQYLHDAIESALNQTYKNIEVIVVNDGSPDNTSEIARKYPVTLIEKKNGGLSSARNAGVKESSGGFIITLDSDDKIDKHYIKKAIGVNDIVSCNIQTFGDNNNVWNLPFEFPTYENNIKFNQLHCCSLYKREVWEAIGGYDENMKEGYEDWDFWNRAMSKGYKVTVLKEPLFWYRKHGKSMVDDAKEKHNKIYEYMTNKYKQNE